MAVDEVLLENRGRPWPSNAAALSMARADSFARLFSIALATGSSTRRTPVVPLYGGPAVAALIVHDRELTYSIAVPQCGALGSATELLTIVHETLLAVLLDLGVEANLYGAAALCRSELRREPVASRFSVSKGALVPILFMSRRRSWGSRCSGGGAAAYCNMAVFCWRNRSTPRNCLELRS